FEYNYLASDQWPGPSGLWNRTLDIYTCPVEPTYDADELNDFMYGLVPELKSTCSDRFRVVGRRNRALDLGVLYYSERMGTASLSAAVEIKEGLSIVRAGAVMPKWQASSRLDLRQKTWVRVFPDAGHLADAAEGHNRHIIPSKELGRRGAGRV